MIDMYVQSNATEKLARNLFFYLINSEIKPTYKYSYNLKNVDNKIKITQQNIE